MDKYGKKGNKKEQKNNLHSIFFHTHSVPAILYHLYTYPLIILWQEQKHVQNKQTNKSLPTCWLHSSLINNAQTGYELLSTSSRLPVCRDCSYFSATLTSLFNPLGKSLRFSTTFFRLVCVLGISRCSAFWGLKGCRYLVAVLAYLCKNKRVFLVRGFEHCWF